MFERLFGRTKPPRANLDALFALPGAALTLQAALDLRPTGVGGVAFRAAEGGSFARTEQDVVALLGADGGPPVSQEDDAFGYTWLVVRAPAASGAAALAVPGVAGSADVPVDVGSLVTDLHAVNTTLEAQGFGPALLCSTLGFRTADGRPVVLVYLYKRGTFYPFAPVPGAQQRRDNALELQVRGAVGADLPVEPDLERWFALWGAPSTT